ncbi:MAG TPA: ATP-binding protein [Verrucomicrobiae bacterium]|nr:ATP-binding protein [Verrucomicrobiae bacterium]
MPVVTPNRSSELFGEHLRGIWVRTDRMFAGLMLFQWFAGIAVALLIAPKTWEGEFSRTHLHVWAAVLLGGVFTALPVALATTRPGSLVTRHVIAVGQMMTSALLIHLTGGRIESHFHVFGSLAFLAFYRDWPVLITASAVVGADHILRGVYWPQSVYGVASIEPWRWVEHVWWVVFEDFFLVISILQSRSEMSGIAERQTRLEASNTELEAFSYSVSHDLRTPLRHISGFSAQLQRHAQNSLDDKARHHLDQIVRSADRMGRLIDDLLSFSRMGRSEMQRATVPLGPLVKEAVQDLHEETKTRRIDWTIGPLPEVKGDPAMLRLVLANLLSNAVKYTRTRTEARVEIGARSANGETTVFVRDNGVGFDMQYVDNLFGIFQRLHSAEAFEGTGIGLANVRRIIHRHGGRTWAEGEVDEGAAFYFSLPTTAEGGR